MNPLYLIRGIVLGNQECPDDFKKQIGEFWKILDTKKFLGEGSFSGEIDLCSKMMILLENPYSDFAYERLLECLKWWETYEASKNASSLETHRRDL